MSDMWRVWIVLLIFFFAGCATTATGPVQEQTEPRPINMQGIWDVRTGERIELEELFDRLGSARFVLVGESHGNEWHHRVQSRIYEGLSDRNPGSVLLGMEMVEARFQRTLDRYVKGQIGEGEMLERVGWQERWGVDPMYYAPMWRRARVEGQRVIGLNARRELVRKVGQVGIAGLNYSEQGELPDMELGPEAYRQDLERVFLAHGMGSDSEGLERFFQAQVLWDEMMAETAFKALEQAPPGAQMMIVSGRGHIERGYGIPSRLIRRGAEPEEVVTIIAVSRGSGKAAPRAAYRDLEWLDQEGIADYVWLER